MLQVQVQKRVTDLIRVIDGLLVDMQQRGVHWKGFLDKLAVINMAHHQVRAAVLLCMPQQVPALNFTRTFPCENSHVGLIDADNDGAAPSAAPVHSVPQICGQSRHRKW
jgi:hypothetical protein